MEVGHLPDLPSGAGGHIHQGVLKGHDGGTFVHTSGAQLLKTARTYSPVPSNIPSYFIFLFSTWVPAPSSRGLNF